MPRIHTSPMHLPDHVWQTISVAVTAEPKIDSTRNTPERLKDLYESDLAVVLMSGSEAMGFIAAWPVAEGFVEIGSIWIRKDFRGQGLSKELYRAVASLSGISNVVTFGITTNPISVRVGTRVGLTIVEDWDRCIPSHLSCGICEIMTPAERPTCPKRGVSCWLRVMIRK